VRDGGRCASKVCGTVGGVRDCRRCAGRGEEEELQKCVVVAVKKLGFFNPTKILPRLFEIEAYCLVICLGYQLDRSIRSLLPRL